MKLFTKLKKLIFILLIFGLGFGLWQLTKSGGIPKFPSGGWKTEQTPAEKPIKFAVFSDIHEDWENLQKALDLAKKDDSEFVIVTGDLTMLGNKSELEKTKSILDKSGLKYYVTAGNHDLWTSQKLKKQYFNDVFGPDYQSFKIGGTKFILFDNGGVPNEIEVSWLQAESQECLKITCLVFMHMPLNHPTSLHIMGESNKQVAAMAEKITAFLAKDKVKEIFAGHLHFSSSYDLEGLHTTIVGAITGPRNVQSPKFLEVTDESGNLTEKEVFLGK